MKKSKIIAVIAFTLVFALAVFADDGDIHGGGYQPAPTPCVGEFCPNPGGELNSATGNSSDSADPDLLTSFWEAIKTYL